jgi:transcriptional regulator with XRE-family HTH domain
MTAWRGGRLVELRIAAGLTQSELAERCGVGRDAVAKWEADKREPGWTNILALAKALGVSCEAFAVPPSEDAPPAPEPKKLGRPRKAEQAEALDAGAGQAKGRKRKSGR